MYEATPFQSFVAVIIIVVRETCGVLVALPVVERGVSLFEKQQCAFEPRMPKENRTVLPTCPFSPRLSLFHLLGRPLLHIAFTSHMIPLAMLSVIR